MKLPQPPLLLVTDRKQARGELEDVVAAALAAGCRWISLREKDLRSVEQLALARRLLPLARRHGATLTLHGAAELALEAGLDGVHLPAGSDARAARVLLGPDSLIGISLHTVEEVRGLDPALVDYAVVGPAFLTASKPGYGPSLEQQGIAAMAAASPVPLIAIGGIEPGNVLGLLQARAAGVAVMGGVMRASDPGAETERLLGAMERYRPR